uniref:Uncharacterized protein n=1 Tax=Avena sativa TaxID=4498 RepID=A0ACD5VNS4_AVESA
MGEEKRLWMEAALTVPETLRQVGTSEAVLASIADACKLLAEDIWGSEDLEDADAVDAPSSTTAGGSVSEASEHSYGFGALLPTTCGLEHTIGTPLFTAVVGEQSYRFAVPFHPARGYGSEVASEPTSAESEEIARGGAPAYDERVHDTLVDDGGFDLWANLLAGALGPDGPFATAHREITRLIALHGEAGLVLARCAAPLGLLLRRDDNDDDRAAAAFLPSAHTALQSLSSAASATAAAEDFLRWRSPESPRRSGWGSVGRRLVGDARRHVLEAQRAVEGMREAAVRDFFHAWMVIKRAPS